jgi:transposase-like protein
MKRREYTKEFKQAAAALSNQEGSVSKSGPVDQWLLQLAPAAGEPTSASQRITVG